MVVARRFLVSGRVQGVGFRLFAQDHARAEGLHGWVANRPDGGVELLAEGELEAVERFERKLRPGPPAARVERLARSDVAPSDRATGFTIEHWPVTLR
jgi:acylphosphatase